MILLLVFSFLAGLVTILAPCIWPVLPIVLSSSLGSKGHQRPLGITLGVMASFTIFTLTISYLVRLFGLDPNIIRTLAVIIIALLGLMMVIPALATSFELLVSRLANIFSTRQPSTSGFLPGFITGLSLGVVWSPCAGPILAAITALAATGKVSVEVILVTLAYVIGVGVPLFLFAYGGQQLVARAKILNAYTQKIQQVFGIIMILAAIAIYANFDQTLQLYLLTKFPALGTAVNSFENSSAVKDELTKLTHPQAQQSPDFVGIDKWLNTDKPLTIASLKGKVVLVDFWTYTCINCIRTLPHVTAWYDKYKDYGFVVVGIHTPEFQFEHDTNNVLAAIKTYNIHYPVAQDNEYATWNNFNNQYWPAEYLIDKNGVIVDTHFGEGDYAKTEEEIMNLLNITGTVAAISDQTPSNLISPETYLGLARNPDHKNFSYSGDWKFSDEYITSGTNSSLSYQFTASKVFIILRPSGAKTNLVKVFLDGKATKTITVDSDKLYPVVDLQGKTETHTVRLEFETPGIQAYTFTFG